ncbi:unnamed protein product [Polarella glacialis]|uniref:C3H1-type domain-containing protein n=1 Tax=Polarella glacialis TaxID=89957 RepID=A0A813GQL1_POLGL|nr:unnamed protein product [Polarella glacialis]
MAYTCATPLKYCYRSTFIDVIEPHQQEAHFKKRSHSVPATRAAPACDEEPELRSYVASLGQRAEQLVVLSRRSSNKTNMFALSTDVLADQDHLETCSTASPTSNPTATSTNLGEASSCSPRVPTPTSRSSSTPDTEMVPEDRPSVLQNPGSMAHPELCRRPCIYFAAGTCSNGSACGYCHLNHENRPSHLDRRHRDIVRSLSEAERLALLLTVLRCRAESTGLAAESLEVLALLEDKAGACAAASTDSRAAASRAALAATSPQHQLSKLSAALRKMPFSTVLAMALRGGENKREENSWAEGGSSDQLLLEAVERMRAQFAPQAVSALTAGA